MSKVEKCSKCVFVTYAGYCTCHDMESLEGKVCTDYKEDTVKVVKEKIKRD